MIDEKSLVDEKENQDADSTPTFLEQMNHDPKSINYVKNVYGSVNEITVIISQENQKKIKKVFENHDLSISLQFRIDIVKSTLKDIIPYFEKIGNIVLINNDVCLFQNEDDFYIVSIDGRNTISYLLVDVFSSSLESARNSIELFKEKFKNISVLDKIIMSLTWFYDSQSNIRTSCVNEEINDKFFKEAYPYLDIDKICEGYLNSDEPVLILLGPPGTGKTRLIRYILKKMHERHGTLSIAFTSDQHVIENSELFINFLLENYQALVIEDIDYHLRPRADGNGAMYNFLTASNSIIINYFSQKKIILSTNLPDINNIDDALLRPGRCYDIIETRCLVGQEISNLSKVLNKKHYQLENKHSIAEIFNSSFRKIPKTTGF